MRNDTPVGFRCRLARYLTSPADPPLVPDRKLPPADLQAVFFDLCGVLYDDTTWRRWLFHLLSRMGLHTQYVLFFRVWDREFRDDVAWGRVGFWQALSTFLRSAGLSRSQAEEVEAAGRARIREFEQNIRPFPHLRGALAELTARGVHLGVHSSLPLTSEQLAAKLAPLHLAGSFQTVVSARQWTPESSREERFRSLVAAADVPAHRAAYVGRFREELGAAARVGLYAIAFNPEPDANADLNLDEYSQLPRLIGHTARPLLAAG